MGSVKGVDAGTFDLNVLCPIVLFLSSNKCARRVSMDVVVGHNSHGPTHPDHE